MLGADLFFMDSSYTAIIHPINICKGISQMYMYICSNVHVEGKKGSNDWPECPNT